MYQDENDLPALLTFDETMEYLFICKNTLLKLLHEGKLKGSKVGRKWRIRKEDLIDFTKNTGDFD